MTQWIIILWNRMFAVPLSDQDCEICFVVLSRVHTTASSSAVANNDDQMRYRENCLC